MKFSNVLISVLTCALVLHTHAGQDAPSGQINWVGKYALIGGAAVAAGAAAYALFTRPDACKCMFRRVRNCFFSPSKETLDRFFKAVRNSDLSTVQRFIENGIVPINVRNSLGATALIQAAQSHGNETLVRWLVEKGAHVQARDNRGNTALHLTHNARVAAFLIDNGIDIEARNDAGNTALHMALEQHSSEMTRFLLTRDAQVNVMNNKGIRPLHLSADIQNDWWAIPLLLEYGADVNVQDYDGNTPLHGGVCSDSAGLLLDSGAMLNAQTKDGQTPLHKACLRQFGFRIACKLLESGANPNVRMNNGQTPLHVAASSDSARASAIWALLKHGVEDIDARDNVGKTPLYFAMECWCKALKASVLPHWQVSAFFEKAEALIEGGAWLTQDIESMLNYQSLGISLDRYQGVRRRLTSAQNRAGLRQALAYLDQDEHAYGVRVPMGVQGIIRDMVLEPDQRVRFSQLR